MSGDGRAPSGIVRRFIRWLQAPESDGWVELVAVILLSTASLAGAFSGYQAAVWGGQQSTLNTQASARRVEATDASMTAYLYAMTDTLLFNDFADAFTEGDEVLMDFYERQFSERLMVAYEAWRASDPMADPNAPASPFMMDAYQIPERERAENLTREADDLLERGMFANTQSKAFVLNTVYLASVLFMAGVATKVRYRPGRMFLVVLGGALLIYGLVHAAGLPTA